MITAFSPLGAGKSRLLDEPIVKNISSKHNKTPAQVLIRYQLDRNVTVIPKSTDKSRLLENFRVFDFRLDQEDIELLNSLNKNFRFSAASHAKNHTYFPFNEPF